MNIKRIIREEMDDLNWISDIEPSLDEHSIDLLDVGDVLESLVDTTRGNNLPGLPGGLTKGEKLVIKKINGYNELLLSTIPFKGWWKGDSFWLNPFNLKYFKLKDKRNR
jgi:hypothetical protein